MKKQFKNFNEYQYSPEHITRLLNDDKSPIEVKFADGSSYVCQYGDQGWLLNGKRHRTDGPAAIYSNGDQFWFLNGRRHRTNGPASIYADGTQQWYLNGKRHRTVAPAVIFPDGNQYWFLNGIEMTEKEHANAIQKL